MLGAAGLTNLINTRCTKALHNTAVAVLVTTEEEGAVAALADVEVWFGTPKSSVRRLLVRLLVFCC